MVFIVRCHRSPVGDTHKKSPSSSLIIKCLVLPVHHSGKECGIKSSRKYTTTDLFHKPLHKYTIVDAIKDENVLSQYWYVGRYKKKDSANEVDIEVEGIDTKELMESDVKVGKDR